MMAYMTDTRMDHEEPWENLGPDGMTWAVQPSNSVPNLACNRRHACWLHPAAVECRNPL